AASATHPAQTATAPLKLLHQKAFQVPLKALAHEKPQTPAATYPVTYPVAPYRYSQADYAQYYPSTIAHTSGREKRQPGSTLDCATALPGVSSHRHAHCKAPPHYA